MVIRTSFNSLIFQVKMNKQIVQLILNQYLREFPEHKDEYLEPVEIQQNNNKVVLIAKSIYGYRMVAFQNERNGYVKFKRSICYSGFEHVFGDTLNFLNGVFEL